MHLTFHIYNQFNPRNVCNPLILEIFQTFIISIFFFIMGFLGCITIGWDFEAFNLMINLIWYSMDSTTWKLGLNLKFMEINRIGMAILIHKIDISNPHYKLNSKINKLHTFAHIHSCNETWEQKKIMNITHTNHRFQILFDLKKHKPKKKKKQKNLKGF